MIKIEDGNLVIDGEVIKVNNLSFVEEVSRGANGIVFLATDTSLNREVAFKIWLKLKQKDFRDKHKQGLKEMQKQIEAKKVLSEWHDPKLDNPYFVPDKSDILTIPLDLIGEVYFTGFVKEYFYTAMEFIKGFTLKEFLPTSWYDDFIPYGVKVHIALQLTRYNQVLMNSKIVHGDLHWKNIMITDYTRTKSFIEGNTFSYKIRIIDFGTSYYSGKEVSVDRAFRTLIETVNHCIAPLKLEDIKACSEPEDTNDINEMTTWIIAQLQAIRAAFFELKQEYVGWPFYREFGTYALKSYVETKYVKDSINKLANEGKIILLERFIGDSKTWDAFDGRRAIRGD